MPGVNAVEIFGCNVFSDTVAKERLPKAVYRAMKQTVDEGRSLDPSIADAVANAMKDWAIEKGATHFTHWFQPMTGITAEKHDSFISPNGGGTVIAEFSGKELIKGEPDASSFPSGGLRATFEARGYTAWDCTSPAFYKDGSLFIPTAFCSYTGEALDKKTPLLRSMEALSEQALRIVKLFGNTAATCVVSTVGPEQEYFIVDKSVYEKRLDLKLTGRTLFGAKSPKGQELEDHYFGALKQRIADFMKDVDEDLWRLGVFAKTKHNEVAPGQHELAPIFTTSNVATDHNQLTMETLRRVADKHGLACLLHEKPFAGVNGSGKHNNWSMSTNDGQNLLEPGKTPHQNERFLTVLCAVITAVDEYADLLRMSCANPGNDHRLGANEAPPAIISIFLGDQLTAIMEQIALGNTGESKSGGKLLLGVNSLPALPRDSTDRNRTSPFAFTGNKFEFRMLGSSQSIAGPNVVLNTIVAETLMVIADRLDKATNFQAEVAAIISETWKEHGRVVFNGNGYADEWVDEAARRGLANISNSVDSFKATITDKSIALFPKHAVLSEAELRSRFEIHLENYIKTINIEALTMIHMAKRQILPAAIKFARELADSVNAVKAASPGADVSAAAALLVDVSAATAEFSRHLSSLDAAAVEAEAQHGDAFAHASFYRDVVFKAMRDLRATADALESMVDASLWPVPTYAEMLFSV